MTILRFVFYCAVFWSCKREGHAIAWAKGHERVYECRRSAVRMRITVETTIHWMSAVHFDVLSEQRGKKEEARKSGEAWPPVKKRKLSVQERMRRKQRQKQKKAPQDEYSRFKAIVKNLHETYPSSQVEQFEKNPLKFWIAQEGNLPLLAKRAKQVYTIPTSSTSAERGFSYSKISLSGHRGNKSFERNNSELFY